MNSINYINNLSKDEFCNIFGNVFEKTLWITKKAYELKPFLNIESLQKSFLSIYDKCDQNQYIEIFNSHPQLVIEKIMTAHSEREQSQSNLNSCTKGELEAFTLLNSNYKKKFNFPFIIAVAGLNKKDILDKFRQRINKNFDEEFAEAKIQVRKIGELRLNQILYK